jgi:hypothetical protein
LRQGWMIAMVMFQRIYRGLTDIMGGGSLGEELISVCREADSVGVQNWERKVYR